eukprot:767126-Hanusia_phi.AAC.1
MEDRNTSEEKISRGEANLRKELQSEGGGGKREISGLVRLPGWNVNVQSEFHGFTLRRKASEVISLHV